MSLKRKVAFTLILSLVFNFLGSSIAFSETGFKAIGIKDNTKIISNQYKSKNGFKYSKDGAIYTTPAFDFHIFSKETNLNGHTNGNIATKDLVSNAAFGTSQATELKLNEENYFMNSAKGINNIASDGNIIVGTNVPTSLEDNNNKVNIGINGNGLDQIRSSNVYKETSESINYIDIDSELENLKTISKLFSENSTSNGVSLSSLNGENQTISVDGTIGNTNNYYLNVKASEISNGVNKRVISIKIPQGKTLIINVDMLGLDINYLQSLVTVINNYSNSEDVVRYENNVLWNLYDSSAADKLFSTGDKYASVGISDYFMGTILAPKANIKYGAVNGSIIANKTQQNGQESHKWTFTGHSTQLVKGTTATIEGLKKLTGKTLEAGMFSFNLLDESGKVIQRVENDKDGFIKFTAIPYNEAGDYKYTVQEVKGNLAGITYDEREFNVTVNVSDDGAGNLVSKVIYQEGKIEFANKYQTKGTSVSLEATKILKGKDLKANMFEFQLKDRNDEIKEIVKNDGDGKIKFSALNFNEVGTYTYKIEEINGKMNGIIYDSQAVDVIITVIYNGEGELKTDIKYPNKQPVFNNLYSAGATTATIEGLKKLTGKTLEAGMFSFNLLDETGNVIQTARNDKDGLIKFTDISYDKVGDYKYKVQEVKGNLAGVTYDSRVFNITVNVSDDGAGNLVAKVIYPEGKIIFENKVIKGSLEITKVGYENGKYLENAEFTIRDAEGKVIGTGRTDKNGKLLFEGLEYGKYTYEETVQPKGYILDNNKYSFEIKEDGVVVKYTMTNKKAPVVITNTSNSNTPNTGDTGIATSLIILILGVGGLFINNKRKIKNKIS